MTLVDLAATVGISDTFLSWIEWGQRALPYGVAISADEDL